MKTGDREYRLVFYYLFEGRLGERIPSGPEQRGLVRVGRRVHGAGPNWATFDANWNVFDERHRWRDKAQDSKHPARIEAQVGFPSNKDTTMVCMA